MSAIIKKVWVFSSLFPTLECYVAQEMLWGMNEMFIIYTHHTCNCKLLNNIWHMKNI